MKRSLLCMVLLVGFAVSGQAAQKLLVCLGDSLTAGYGLDEEFAYPAQLERSLAPAWRVSNAGVTGDTSAGGLKRLDWVLRSHPDAVFVALGANDGLRGLDPDMTEANLTAIVKKIRSSGAEVYLAGLDLPTNLGGAYRRQFKAIYPRVAKAQKVPLLGFLLKGVAGVAALNQADGIHPNQAGQAKVAAHVLEFLEPNLKSPRANKGGRP